MSDIENPTCDICGAGWEADIYRVYPGQDLCRTHRHFGDISMTANVDTDSDDETNTPTADDRWAHSETGGDADE